LNPVLEVRAMLERADLVGMNLERGAEAMGVSTVWLGQRLRRAGSSWRHELARERRRRLLEQLEDAPESEVHCLMMICGYRWQVSLDEFCKRELGCTLTEWRRGQAKGE
jgi:AraC-like DNA-binding protein